MAKLTDEEQSLLKKLKAKMDAPEAPAVGKSVQVIIDLGDAAQVKLAKLHGFLTGDDDDSEDDAANDDDDDSRPADTPPRRSGYFD